MKNNSQAHLEIREKQTFPGEKVPIKLLKTAETMPENAEHMLDFCQALTIQVRHQRVGQKQDRIKIQRKS